MRPIVIVMLVFMHSFTMFTGGAWKLPDGIHNVTAYDWLAKITFSFLLETFIFISGYLLQAQLGRRVYDFFDFVQKKAKRLLLPSVMFSFAYYILFMEDKGIVNFIFSIFEGCGHMWYLPMSFWCFLGGFVLYRLNCSIRTKLLLCIALACCSGGLGFLPLRLNSASYYMLFFYLGMLVYEKRLIFQKITSYQIIFLCISYLVAFIFLRSSMESLSLYENGNIVFKVMRILIIPLCRIVYSSLGLFSFYLIVTYYLQRHPTFQSSSWLVYINSIALGIYIYHQFLLKLLYYNTTLPCFLGSYVLPWVGFLLSLVMSILLSSLTIKTKIGKFLIG